MGKPSSADAAAVQLEVVLAAGFGDVDLRVLYTVVERLRREVWKM